LSVAAIAGLRIVLPAKPANVNELWEEELEKIADGCDANDQRDCCCGNRRWALSMQRNSEAIMAEQEQTLTRHDLEAKIVKRCWEDEAFRAELTADPAGAFVKYLQVPAASLPRISFYQEELGSWHIVLPVKPPNAGELSEEDLERVAGANSGVCVSQKVSPLISYGISAMSAAGGVSCVVVYAAE
jgi:hypothetical protein